MSRMGVTTYLPLPSGSFFPGVDVPVRGPVMGQMNLFKIIRI